MKILVAVDDHSHESLRVAKELFPEAEHSIISATAISQFMMAEPLTGAIISGGYSVDTIIEAEERADKAVALAQDVVGDGAETRVEVGDAGPVICTEAVRIGAQVIVVGRREHNWVSRIFDPSVSEYVIRHASCPVLVVREAAK
jgi:nucleotide-binding universal stress UspA family protein